MRRECKGLTWGRVENLVKVRGRNEVLKPNCYIVAGLFYLYDLGMF